MADEQESYPSQDRQLQEAIAAYLDAVAAGKAPNREEFLAAHARLARELAEFFDDHDAVQQLIQPFKESGGGEEVTQGPASAEIGTRVRYFGDYELLEEIACGGMGVVYKARQRSLNRLVAVKMVRAGLFVSDEEVQRFHREAEAAANLQHPGIVAIHEVGRHAGQHYFSMDYIEGQSLAAKLAEGPLPAPAAAELLAAVAEAVHYAHQKGVIHRDLKPSNIVLDQDGRPHVTDFGLAKRVEGESELTGAGQVLGTPSYMPPEQAAAQIDRVGPASDVYALGAVLYACLVGRPPFQAASSVDTLRQVLDKEPAPPRQLNAGVPRDLETIALKCLEKEPNRRYATAAAMVEDLRRYARGEPILARPIGRLQRTWRWCKRNRLLAAATAAAVLCLVLALTATTWGYVSTRRALHEAEDARRKAEASERNADANLRQARAAVEEYFTKVSESTLLKVPGSEPLRNSLLESALKYYQSFVEQHRNDPELTAELASAYLRLGMITKDIGLQRSALESLTRARQILEPLIRDNPNVKRYRSELAAALFGSEQLRMSAGEHEAALADAQKALEILKRLVAEHPASNEYRSRLAGAYFAVGNVYHVHMGMEKPAEALAAFAEAKRIARRLVVEKPESAADILLLASICNNEGSLYVESGRTAEAMAVLGETVRLLEPRWTEGRAEAAELVFLADAHGNIGVALADLGQHAAAIAAYEKSRSIEERLAAGSPAVGDYRASLATTYLHLAQSRAATGEPKEALAAYNDVARILEPMLRENPNQPGNLWVLGTAYHGIACLHAATGKPDEALASFAKAFGLLEQIPQSAWISGEMARLREHRARVYALTRQWRRAAEEYAKAIKDDPSDHTAWVCLAVMRLQDQDVAGYRDVCHQVLARFGEIKDPALAEITARVLLLRSDAVDDSTRLTLLIDRAHSAPPGHRILPWAQVLKGLAEYRRDRYESAVQLLHEALKSKPKDPRLEVTALLTLAMAHHRLGRVKESELSFQAASEIMEARFPKSDDATTRPEWMHIMIARILYQEAAKLVKHSGKADDRSKK